MVTGDRRSATIAYAHPSSRYSGSRRANRYYLGYGQRQGRAVEGGCKPFRRIAARRRAA